MPFRSTRIATVAWTAAVLLSTPLLVRQLPAQDTGRIVAISAGSAFIRTHSVYGLAKDALRHHAQGPIRGDRLGLALELEIH